MKVLDKYAQLNAITDVWAPRYHDNVVLIDINKIKRSKLDIKLRFSDVNDTSEYAGDWFLSRAKALKGRKKFDNNSRTCIQIPFSEFEKLQISERSRHEL